MKNILLAVNGTLMRGLELNRNLVNAGAEFVKETTTSPAYRLWSIKDQYPAMIRDADEGQAIALEVWRIPVDALPALLEQEPPGLCLGKVELNGGTSVFGILGEPYICIGQQEITRYGGWRSYLQNK